MENCKLCNNSFKTVRDLAIHVSKIHIDIKWKKYRRLYLSYCEDKPFICELCNDCFLTPSGLSQHLSRVEKVSKDDYIKLYPENLYKIKIFYKEFLKTKYVINENTGCWTWTGTTDNDGYGGYNHQRAHRLFYELYKGTINNGFLICHTCDNPSCVNPDHLYEGTNQSNMDDMVLRDRSLKGDKNPAKKEENRKKISENNPMKKEENRKKISIKFKGRKAVRYFYNIISPDLNDFISDNLFKFCKEKHLDYRRLLEVACGYKTNFNGWYITRTFQK